MCDVLERWRYRKWHLIDVMNEELWVSGLLADDRDFVGGWDYMDDQIRRPMTNLARYLTEHMGRQVYFDLVCGEVRVFLEA